MARYVLYTDGAARGNPGPAAIGAVLYRDDGLRVGTIGETVGVTTNNVAEYQALLAGLRLAMAVGVEDLTVRADSELLVRQIEGTYKVKSERLKPLYQTVRRLLSGFRSVTMEHIPRERNTEADALANAALDWH